MPSEINRALGRGKKKGLTHREVMHKRHLKRRKKEAKNNGDRKMKLLKEYQELNKVKYSSKKDTSMAIMELVEDVKEKIPSGVYLDIMNQLMALNKEKETYRKTKTKARPKKSGMHATRNPANGRRRRAGPIPARKAARS